MSQNLKFAEFLEKFGINKKLAEKFEFLENKNDIRITSKDYIEEASLLGAIHGVKIFRKGAVLNPSSNFVFVFGKMIRKRKISLSLKELIDFFNKGEIEIRGKCKNHGYLFVEYKRKILALGFLKNGILKCFMPKYFREIVLEVLTEEHSRK